MVHFLASDEKYRDVIHDDDFRPYPATPGNLPSDYRFGRMQGKRAPFHARNVLRRIAAVVISILRSAVSALVTFLGPSWDGPVRKYRPEDHYMRGPGPKWREKHVPDHASAGRT
jgi:hypothetical protein